MKIRAAGRCRKGSIMVSEDSKGQTENRYDAIHGQRRGATHPDLGVFVKTPISKGPKESYPRVEAVGSHD